MCYIAGGGDSGISSKISKINLEDSREGMRRTSISWNGSLQPLHFSTSYTSYENCEQNDSASPDIIIGNGTTSDLRLKAVYHDGSIENLRSEN